MLGACQSLEIRGDITDERPGSSMADLWQLGYTCSVEWFLRPSFCFCQGFDKFLGFHTSLWFLCSLWIFISIVGFSVVAGIASDTSNIQLHELPCRDSSIFIGIPWTIKTCNNRLLEAFRSFQCIWVLRFFLFSLTPRDRTTSAHLLACQEQKRFNQCWPETSLF